MKVSFFDFLNKNERGNKRYEYSSKYEKSFSITLDLLQK